MIAYNKKTTFIQKIFLHLKTIHIHRFYVLQYCFRCGLYRQGLLHDLSKYSLPELLPSVRYFQGFRSPYAREKEVHGYSAGWLHHKGKNKHHWEYWWDTIDGKWQPLKMPAIYVVESLCDRIAACRVYQKDKYRQDAALIYYQNSTDSKYLHPETARLLLRLLESVAEHGEKITFGMIRKILKNKQDLYKQIR